MRLLLAAIVGLLPVAAHAVPMPSPQAVRAQIQRVGPKTTVTRLDGAGDMDRILDAIGTGDPQWIALAPLLALGTDGADGEGLGIELATALPINPAAVLRITTPGDGVLGLLRVCGVPFIESTPASDKTYLRQAVAAVAGVSDPTLKTSRDQCLARLRS